MKRFSLILNSLFFVVLCYGQDITEGLVAHYTFDDCSTPIILDDFGNNNGIFEGASLPDCACGVSGSAISFDGNNDYVRFENAFQDVFNTKDFSISFYLKTRGAVGIQNVLAKRKSCQEDRWFSIGYGSNADQISGTFWENASKTNIVTEDLSDDVCWHHIVVVRQGLSTTLYVDGVKSAQSDAVSRVDLTNTGDLFISPAAYIPCEPNDVPFKGLIDELRIYKVAIDEPVINELFIAPDRISNPDTIVFLGESVQAGINTSCADAFNWTPIIGVSDVTIEDPLLSPEETTTYYLELTQSGCTARDSFTINVIDPDQVDCQSVFLPKAFTPNNDGLNENFGISNPFAISELLSFEIFDRWGSRVFYTENIFDRWDGTFLGKEVNPGVYLYRLNYRCQNEEVNRVGNITVIR